MLRNDLKNWAIFHPTTIGLVLGTVLFFGPFILLPSLVVVLEPGPTKGERVSGIVSDVMLGYGKWGSSRTAQTSFNGLPFFVNVDLVACDKGDVIDVLIQKRGGLILQSRAQDCHRPDTAHAKG